MMDTILRVKNWAQFQHYKDRAPAWIKLHRNILDDYDFHSLPVASRALAPMLWLIASEHENGEIDADPARLAFRLRMSEQDVIDALKPLIYKGFFILEQDASGLLATCLPREEKRREEKEREEEKEEKPQRVRAAPSPARPQDVAEKVWADWLELRRRKKAPVTDTVLSGAIKEAEKARISLQDFLEIWCLRGTQGFMADWIKPSELNGRRRGGGHTHDLTTMDYTKGVDDEGRF